MIYDFFYLFTLMVYTVCVFFSGCAAFDDSGHEGAHAARCIFWPLSIFMFLVLLVIGVRA